MAVRSRARIDRARRFSRKRALPRRGSIVVRPVIQLSLSTKKKPNPQDSTLRNVRAANRRVAKLGAQIAKLTTQVTSLRAQLKQR